MADNKYKILLRRGNESDLNTAFYDIGEPIFLSNSGKLLIKKNDGTMAVFSEVVESKNLFDLKLYLNMLSNDQKSIISGVLDTVDKCNNSFTFTTTGHDCYTSFWNGSKAFKIPVDKETTYTMSWNFSGSNGKAFVFFNGISGSENMVQGQTSKEKLTFTTKSDTTFITVRFGIDDNGTSATIGNIQIEVGDKKTYFLPKEIAQGIKELDNKVDDLQVINNQNDKDLDLKKLDKTDFNSYRTSNDNAVNSKVDTTEFNTYKTETDKADKDNADNINLLDTNKANLVRSQNLFDWSKLLTVKSNIFTVNKTEDEGYRITGTTTSKYNNVFPIQTLSLEDGDYYICDNATNNANASVYCQLNLIDTDGNRSYYSNTKVTIDNSKYTSVNLSVQTGATVGEVDTVIYPMLCKYDDANIQYLPHMVSEGIPLIAGCITDIKNKVSAKADNIVCGTNKASSCYLNDSSRNHIKGLSLYGNSIQSQVPTPTVPVNIENVNNPNIALYQKNLFDTSKAIVSMNSKAQLVEWDRQNCSLTFTSNADTINSGAFFRHTTLIGVSQGYGVDYTRLNGKSVTLSFDIQSNTDCKINVQFTKYSNTNLGISTTKQRLSVTEVVDTRKLNKALCFYLNNVEATVTISNIQIEIGGIATDYESCKCNRLTIEKSLHGIGDVCDTLTVNNDGTGYITQRLFAERITSQKKSTSYEWNYSATTNRFFRNDYSYSFDVKDNKPLILCSHLDVGENEKNTAFDNSIGWINVSGVGIAIRMTEFDGDIAKFKKWLDDNEVYMVAPLAKPIRVDLSKDEVDKILSLYTYYPITTIIADCDFQLKYIADTKIYTDYKNDLLDEKIKQNSNDIKKKYDNSKIETGIGNIYYQGTNIIAKFNYTKIENMVTIQIAVSNLPTDKNYLDCLGLPFIATIGQTYRWLAISNSNNQYKLAVSGSHFYINKISGNFASDETITTTFSYLI